MTMSVTDPKLDISVAEAVECRPPLDGSVVILLLPRMGREGLRSGAWLALCHDADCQGRVN